MNNRYQPRRSCDAPQRGARAKVFAVALCFSAASMAWGQAAKAPAPAAPASPYYLDSSSNPIPLEVQTARLASRLHALGFEGGQIVFKVQGERSPVKLKMGGNAAFVVRLKPNMDPVETMQFYRVDATGGSRIVGIENFDALARITKVTSNSSLVDFNATVYGASSYGVSSFKLVPIQPLASGEYCLFTKEPNKWPRRFPAYCFGVDADNR